MAIECSNEIIAFATTSEWREIEYALENKVIDWPACLDGPTCSAKRIYCTTKSSPTPWDDGYMDKMCELYPNVLFHYTTEIEDQRFSPSSWFYGHNQSRSYESVTSFNNSFENIMKQLEQDTATVANGLHHRVEVMPNGIVAADGENRFGECNIYTWEKIKQVSCGSWHTVAITQNGSLLACGSNANGQCDVHGITGKVVSVSCGRYHTAVLLDNGKVIVKGNLEQRALFPEISKEPDHISLEFPIIEKLRLDERYNGWEIMNERIENISNGDELFLRNTDILSTACFEVLDKNGETLGFLHSSNHRTLSKAMQNIRVTASDVMPLSSRKKGVKFAAMKLLLNYSESPIESVNIAGNYSQTKISSWSPVKKIKSVYDAVIGITEEGQILIDGYCPCSENDLKRMMNN